MRSIYRSVVVKKELSRKAKLSIYQSIYVPTLTYGHDLWVMTERCSNLGPATRNISPLSTARPPDAPNHNPPRESGQAMDPEKERGA
ncbi:hypothetical protein QTP70_005970 [Hemibagrus guttatus]|uniref:Uncharacterized protein n=1 Tax=Hemibagrus guttatus TaxID=175788 RepID=A0AAE0V8J4_9TELE|nr:hypothetical protein QTP70_005970 [Hemibagrus guttatus]